MDKQEFFDKIDRVRKLVDDLSGDIIGDDVKSAVHILDELKTDARELLEDEYEEGYDLGLERGFAHIENDAF